MLEKITRNLINEAIRNQKRAGQILVNDAVETGYLDLDYALGGLRRGETYILGGRPAMGKKAFSINLIDNIAVQNKLDTTIYKHDSSDCTTKCQKN